MSCERLLLALAVFVEIIIVSECGCMAVKNKSVVSLNSQIIQQRGKIAALDDNINALKTQKIGLVTELNSLRAQKAKGGK